MEKKNKSFTYELQIFVKSKAVLIAHHATKIPSCPSVSLRLHFTEEANSLACGYIYNRRDKPVKVSPSYSPWLTCTLLLASPAIPTNLHANFDDMQLSFLCISAKPLHRRTLSYRLHGLS